MLPSVLREFSPSLSCGDDFWAISGVCLEFCFGAGVCFFIGQSYHVVVRESFQLLDFWYNRLKCFCLALFSYPTLEMFVSGAALDRENLVLLLREEGYWPPCYVIASSPSLLPPPPSCRAVGWGPTQALGVGGF